MPISKDEFQTINGNNEASMPDLSPDTTQGKLYRFLLRNSDTAYRQRELADAVTVPKGSVGPTLNRLEQQDLVEHRDRYWTIADAEHAVASAGMLATQTADDIDGGFSDDDLNEWMKTAVEPITDDNKNSTGP